MKLKFIATIVFILFTSFPLFAQLQQQQQVRLDNATGQNQQLQQQVLTDVSRTNKKLYHKMHVAGKVRWRGRRAADQWREDELLLAQQTPGSSNIADIEAAHQKKLDQIDSVYYRTINFAYVINRVKVLRVFPAFIPLFSSLYYNGSENSVEFLRTTNVSGLQDNGATATEIVSSYGGPFRVSLGTVLSKQKEIKISPAELGEMNEVQLESRLGEIDSLNRANSTLLKIASGGGEAFLSARTPFINVNGSRKKAPVAFESEIVAIASAGFPVAGSYVEKDDVNYFFVVGLENKVMIRLKTFQVQGENVREGVDALSFFAKYNIRQVSGSEKFYENIGIEKKSFAMYDYTFGLIYKNFNIHWVGQSFGNSKIKDEVGGRLGISIIRTIK